MFVIKNLTDAPLSLDGVDIDPDKQISVGHLTASMVAAKEAGKLQVMDGDETLEERRKDIEAIDSFKPGKL